MVLDTGRKSMDYRILVVEDEPDINNLLARILREEDYKVLRYQ